MHTMMMTLTGFEDFPDDHKDTNDLARILRVILGEDPPFFDLEFFRIRSPPVVTVITGELSAMPTCSAGDVISRSRLFGDDVT